MRTKCLVGMRGQDVVLLFTAEILIYEIMELAGGLVDIRYDDPLFSITSIVVPIRTVVTVGFEYERVSSFKTFSAFVSLEAFSILRIARVKCLICCFVI